MVRNDLLHAGQIKSMIAQGHTLVISEGRVLRLNKWLDRHPGGKLAILHMVGRDATDEMNVYHSLQTQRLMGAYQIGRINEPWINLTPPIRGGTYEAVDHHKAESETSETLSQLPSLNSSSTSLDILFDAHHEQSDSCTEAQTEGLTTGFSTVDSDVCSATGRSFSSKDEAVKALLHNGQNRKEYAFDLMRKERDESASKYPPLDAETQRGIVEKYQALHERVKNERFYDCPYIRYGRDSIRFSILFGLFLFALHSQWYMMSATFLGIFWHQIMFVAHDAGHLGITHSFVADTLVGMFVADFCCGLSIGWWKSSHNVHHLVTNHPEHDPDIQNVPLFAICPSMFNDTVSSYYDGFTFYWDAVADFTIRYQRYTYYPVMAIARFNLYLLSWLHLLSPRSTNMGSARWTRPVEIIFMIGFWYLFGYCLLWRTIPTWSLRVAFVLVSHIVTFPLHVQITLSHWAMPTSNLGEGESFPQRQLRTTMDVDCPEWLDFIHGGLQFQACHHLFPRVPRHNLRRLQALVKQFCKDTNIEYKIYGFVDGNKEVLSRLAEVSKQVDTLVKCQVYMAETGESGLH